MSNFILGFTELACTSACKKLLGGLGAMICVGAAPSADDKPMLWEGTTETVSDKLLDPPLEDALYRALQPVLRHLWRVRRLCRMV